MQKKKENVLAKKKKNLLRKEKQIRRVDNWLELARKKNGFLESKTLLRRIIINQLIRNQKKMDRPGEWEWWR